MNLRPPEPGPAAASAESSSALRQPRRRRVWSRLGFYLILLPAGVLIGIALYIRLVALPTPDTIEELLPPDTLIYLRLRKPSVLVAQARKLAWVRAVAAVDETGKNLPPPEPLPLDDKDSIEDELERRASVRKILYFVERFGKGDIVAALLPVEDPSAELWVFVAELEPSVAEALVSGLTLFVGFGREVKNEIYRGISITAYIDAEEPEDTFQSLRLGDLLVVAIGTPDTGALERLVDRYLGAGRKASFRDELDRMRRELDWEGVGTENGAPPPLLTMAANGALLQDALKLYVEEALRRGEPRDALDALDIYELLAPYRCTLGEIRSAGGRLVLEVRNLPEPDRFRRVRGFPPDGEVAAVGGATVETGPEGDRPMFGGVVARGSGNVARLLQWLFEPFRVDWIDEDISDALLAHELMKRYFEGKAALPDFGRALALHMDGGAGDGGAPLTAKGSARWPGQPDRPGGWGGVTLRERREALPADGGPVYVLDPLREGTLMVKFADEAARLLWLPVTNPKAGSWTSNGSDAGLSVPFEDWLEMHGFPADVVFSLSETETAPVGFYVWLDVAALREKSLPSLRRWWLADADDAQTFRRSERYLELFQDASRLTAASWFDADGRSRVLIEAHAPRESAPSVSAPEAQP